MEPISTPSLIDISFPVPKYIKIPNRKTRMIFRTTTQVNINFSFHSSIINVEKFDLKTLSFQYHKLCRFI